MPGSTRSGQLLLVARGEAHVERQRHRAPTASLDRLLEADGEVADPARDAESGEDAPIAHVVARGVEEMRLGVGRPDPADDRVGNDREVGVDQGHRQRHVEAVGQPVRQERDELRHASVDRVGRRHEIAPAAALLEAVVGEDGRHPIEVHTFNRVEAELLERGSRGEALGANRLGPLGEDRSEAHGRPVEDAEVGVEPVGEARGWRRQWGGSELSGQGDVELREAGLEGAVEVGRVRGAARQCSATVDDQATRSVQRRQQRRQLVYRYGDVERILCAQWRARRDRGDYDHRNEKTAHVSSDCQLAVRG